MCGIIKTKLPHETEKDGNEIMGHLHPAEPLFRQINRGRHYRGQNEDT